MANGAILTAEQERKLRQPIDEYVGKIQKEIDELREHGTAEVIEYQNLSFYICDKILVLDYFCRTMFS